MKTILITGGSSGIGRAAALLFASRGWRVYDLSRHDTWTDEAGGKDSLATVPVHIPCDVTDAQACRDAVAQVIRAEGHIDVLVSNAGMGISGPIEFASSEDAHRLMDVNVHGAMNVVQAVLPQMRAQRHGRIIVVGSVAGTFSIPYQAWYSASKAALHALTAALRNEVRQHGIMVSCLQPGDVRTGFTQARQKSVIGADVYPHAERSVKAMERDEEHGLLPQDVAYRLWRMANNRYVWLNYVAGWKYHLLCVVARLVPATVVNRVVGWMY